MTSKPTILQRTQFDEERARRILLYIYPQKYADAVLADAPDIVCPSAKIGVEVTSGLREDIQQNLARAASITGKTTNELTKNDKANIEKSGFFIFKHTHLQRIPGFRRKLNDGFSHGFIESLIKRNSRLLRKF